MDYHSTTYFAPIEKARRFTIEESKEFLLENFKGFSEDLAQMTKKLTKTTTSTSYHVKEKWGRVL